jgi:hypothetical protein
MTIEERNTIQELCFEYADIFHLEGDVMTCTDAIYYEIKTPSVTQPTYQKPYKLPYAQNGEIAKQVEEMKRDGIITQSNSPWNASLLVVPKKEDASGNKKCRVVMDSGNSTVSQ